MDAAISIEDVPGRQRGSGRAVRVPTLSRRPSARRLPARAAAAGDEPP